MSNFFFSQTRFLFFFFMISSVSVSGQDFCDDFGLDGIASGPFSFDTQYIDLDINSDGKIAVFGRIATGLGLRVLITQLTADGLLDKQSFGLKGISISNKEALTYSGRIIDNTYITGTNLGGIFSGLSSAGNDVVSSPLLGNVTDLLIDESNTIYAVSIGFGSIGILAAFDNGDKKEDFGENGLAKQLVADSAHHFRPANLARMNDGKLIASLAIEDQSDGKDFLGIYRFNTNGTIDNSWPNNKVALDISAFSYHNTDLHVDDNEKIIALGYRFNTGDPPAIIAHRFNSDGNLDASFGSGGIAKHPDQALAKCMIVADDSKIFFVGSTTILNEDHFYLGGFNPDGTPYSGFENQAFLPDDDFIKSGVLNKILLLANKKMLVCGTVTLTDNSTRGIVLRLNENGTIDNTFANEGYYIANTVDGGEILAIAKNGNSLIAAGRARDKNGDFQNALAQYKLSGEMDFNFGYRGGTLNSQYQTFTSLAIAAEGKIWAMGPAGLSDGTFVSKYNVDGTLDQTFSSNGWEVVKGACFGCRETGTHGTLDNNGKIVIAAHAERVKGSGNQRNSVIIRRNADGTADNSFGSSGAIILDLGLQENANRLAVNQDNSLIVGGFHTIMTDQLEYLPYLLKLKPDGSLDQSFAEDGIFHYPVTKATEANIIDIQILQDGKILAIGYYELSGSPRDNGFIVKLQSNGQPDESFAQDGYLSITIGGSQEITIAGLNIDSQGKIIISGYKNGPNQGFVAQYSTNGELLQSYLFEQPGFLPLNQALLLSDDKILLTGWESSYGGFTLACIDLNASGGGITSIDDLPTANSLTLYPNPASDRVTLKINEAIRGTINYQIFNFQGQKILENSTTTNQPEIELSVADFPLGQYIIYVNNGKQQQAIRMIRQ